MKSWTELEERLASARTTGDPVQIAVALDALGALARQDGDNARAQAFYAESLELRYTLGDRARLSTCSISSA